MRAHVLLLRRAGIEQPDKRPQSDWIDGHLQLTRGKTRRGDVPLLELKPVGQHAPDRAPRLLLYEPQLIAMGYGEMTFRGFEILTDRALVVQEWRIDPEGPMRASRAGWPQGGGPAGP